MMNSAVSIVRSMGHDFEYNCYDSYDLDDDPLKLVEALKKVSEADMVTFKVHGDTSYFKKFDRMDKILKETGVCTLLTCTDECVTDAFRPYFSKSFEDYKLTRAYMELGGDDNFSSLILWALRTFDGLDVEIPEPNHPPSEGIYYSGRESIDFETYIDGLDPSKPNIGIFFYQRQWLSKNTDGIDGLISAVEEKGGNPVPVFLMTYASEITGSIGVKRVLSEHLTRDGKPVLDAIIETMSFSQTLVANPGSGEQVSDDNFFDTYGVPVIQSMTLVANEESWRADEFGLNPAEIAYDIVHPEFDGQIISVANASTERDVDGARYHSSIHDRALRVADTAVMWGRLRRKANADRKVAILLYMYPPKTANAGGAAGLDTFQSVVDLLHRMREDGYDVGDRIPETSKELVDTLLSGLTNDTTWIGDDEVKRRSTDIVTMGEYMPWYGELSDSARDRIENDWGKPPGDFYTVDGEITIPGTVFGNVIVGFQPDRGRDIQSDYHDPLCVMPHQYLAYYRWLRHDFGADAVVHIGTHGTLEWLPGKGTAMSGNCCPDYILDSLPDVYPYIIGNPGEGIQAKRRGAAVIVDHMIPTMARAGGYDELQEVEGAVQNYMNATAQGQDENVGLIRSELRDVVARMDLYNDLKLDPSCSDEEFDEKVDELYDYIVEAKEALIKDGLHILGRVPSGGRLNETIYSLMRLDNGNVPSMRGSIAAAMGYDIDDLQNDASGRDGSTGLLKGQVLDDVESRMDSLIQAMVDLGFDKSGCIGHVSREYPGDDGHLMESVSYVCDRLHGDLMHMTDEIDSVIRALEGEYITPGPAGCPTRGRAQLLPTGRNFYSLDPDSIPWHSSWDIGCRMADQMLEKYIDQHGTYPKTVGLVMWATDTMKTGGDDVAYVLWLMGLRPVWTGYAGRVKDIEVIPLEELGRPRIDVTVRISGLFRDSFPNLVNLIDRGVRMIADLDEDEESNYLRANLREDIVRAIESGVPEDEAREAASVRLFGDAPGTYGSGTNILIRTSDWKDVSDIGAIYRSYGEYAYGNGHRGERMPEAFKRRLELMEVTVKNSVSREYDMFDNDDVYTDLGGFNAAVRSVSGKMPMSVIGCSADTSNLKTRTIDEEGRFIFRSKIANPKWVEGLKEHGFKGAQEISNMTEYVFAWDATSDIIEPWMYGTIADHFLFDESNSEWFRDANPYAMFETVSRLLEAVGRGMWEPDPDVLERLKQLYSDLEGDLEGME